MWHAWGRGEVFTGFWLGGPKVRDHCRCSCIAILWASLVSFAATPFILLLNECLLFISSTQSGNFWIYPRIRRQVGYLTRQVSTEQFRPLQ
jgi:hypothetical protein